MHAYPKIETLFDRDEHTHKVIPGQWRCPEFEYLADAAWLCTEKVDGINVRVMYENGVVHFEGRTDAARLPAFLLARLESIFSGDSGAMERWAAAFPPDGAQKPIVCLYGEGYGARLQKGGGNYKPDGVDFVLFDVWVGSSASQAPGRRPGWWLRWDDVRDVAAKLAIRHVPVLGRGTLREATELVCRGDLTSVVAEKPGVLAEGLVVHPTVDLCARDGRRIIGKLKLRDF